MSGHFSRLSYDKCFLDQETNQREATRPRRRLPTKARVVQAEVVGNLAPGSASRLHR